MEIGIKACSKVNLSLEVFGRQSDGYHTIGTIICSLSLADDLRITITEGPTKISSSTILSSQIQVHNDAVASVGQAVEQQLLGLTGSNNLVERAAQAFFDLSCFDSGASSTKGFSVHIDVTKNVPMGAGLGGGSADAAAVLAVLNEFFGRPFDRNALIALATNIGCDVPAMLLGGLVYAWGVGDKVKKISLPQGSKMFSDESGQDIHCVIVKPPCFVDTKKAYAMFSLELGQCLDREGSLRGISHRTCALLKRCGIQPVYGQSNHLEDFKIKRDIGQKSGESLTFDEQDATSGKPKNDDSFALLTELLCNDFYPNAASVYPEIAQVYEIMFNLGARNVVMSGSGSALVALFSCSREAEAFVMGADEFRTKGYFLASCRLLEQLPDWAVAKW